MKTRVLVVDDDPELAMMVRDVLQKAGFDTWTAGPLHAEQLFDAKCFNLLVTDKNMPGVSGYELIRRLRLKAPELPVVLMSAYPEPAIGGLPIQGYLAKPFNGVKSIIDMVQRTLQLSRELAEVKLKLKRAG